MKPVTFITEELQEEDEQREDEDEDEKVAKETLLT